MADFSFTDDKELHKLAAQVAEQPEEFERWEKLVRAAESQEGGLSRNSSPGAIAATRDTYDRFLARFPLFFGYWKKYADLEFAIAGTESAEMVYERGVASIGTSVDLWANYCGFKIDTSHDPEVIRELFERGAESVGLDFLAHPFWDKYIEFEERNEAKDRIFAVLARIVHIPLHQYARYFERYRNMAKSRPIVETAPPEKLSHFHETVLREVESQKKSEQEMEQELRAKIDAWYLDIFHRTQAETTKRWTYESEVKRPYYHVTDLDETQLANWRKYLDFEQAEGDYLRTRFLYERCLVTAANYEEFWLRYARWTLAQENKQEEVRSIYQRASCIYVPISTPTVRLFYAQFEESQGRADVAIAIYEAVLMSLPSHTETILALTNAHRRQSGLQWAIEVLNKFIDGSDCTMLTRGTLVSELARLMQRKNGDPDAARRVYEKNKKQFADVAPFWVGWLRFELQQPYSEAQELECHTRVKAVFDSIRQSRLPTDIVQDVSDRYFAYLKDRGGKDAMEEYLRLDQEINGPGEKAGDGQDRKPSKDLIAPGRRPGSRGGLGGLPNPNPNTTNGMGMGVGMQTQR